MTEDSNQMLSAISELLDRKSSSELPPIRQDLAGLKQDFGSMKQDMVGLKQEVGSTKQDMTGLRQELRDEIRSVEISVLEEIDRVQEILENRLDKQDKRIDVLEQYYRIRKDDNENMSVVLKLVLNLKEDVDVLKAKIS